MLDTKYTIRISLGDSEDKGNGTTPLNGGAAIKGMGSGSNIDFNPNSSGFDIVNSDGSTGRMAEIGLAHELLHARKNKNGEHDEIKDENKIDPDTKQRGVLTKEEIQVRKEDSEIRKEQGQKERAQPHN